VSPVEHNHAIKLLGREHKTAMACQAGQSVQVIAPRSSRSYGTDKRLHSVFQGEAQHPDLREASTLTSGRQVPGSVQKLVAAGVPMSGHLIRRALPILHSPHDELERGPSQAHLPDCG